MKHLECVTKRDFYCGRPQVRVAALPVLLFLLLASLPAFASGTRLAEIKPDQASYAVGGRAILFLPLKRPTTSGMEFHLELKSDSAPATVVPLSADLAVAVSDRFAAPGTKHWDLAVYQQDRKEQLSLAKALAAYDLEIAEIEALLSRTTNPPDRAALEERLRVAQTRREILAAQAAERRTLVDRVHGVSRVTPGYRGSSTPTQAPALFSLRAGRDPAAWIVGESAAFYAQPLVAFRGPDGVREPVLRSRFLGTTYYGTPVLTETMFTLPAFTAAHIGSQSLAVDFLIRSKRQADRLRSAANLAMQKRDAYRDERAAAVDPADRAWLDLRIAEMQSVTDALFQQLEEILTPVDSGDISFTVNP